MIYQKNDFKQMIDISDEAFEKIEMYHALLLKWNKAINLVSPKSIEQAWHRHFLDSAQLSKAIPQGVKIYADLGCGGGFPGLVLAIMNPDIAVHLVESDERKGQFMRNVVRETGLSSVTIHTKRVEAVTDDFYPDFVTARALSSLETLFEYCLPWAQQNKGLSFCFMKGERANEEISMAQKRFNFEYNTIPSLTDNTAQLLFIKKLACV
ncbi:MAG: 16S rRNA (guanine(527)-N(7))-methyltransferase RsmG [Alphaproteobacteria bacterium]|nr:MAG: 16S rRNA (guanine(527)-N(7))-methyltransferase RsmG [Alphaproteobacteria bacterium]